MPVPSFTDSFQDGIPGPTGSDTMVQAGTRPTALTWGSQIPPIDKEPKHRGQLLGPCRVWPSSPPASSSAHLPPHCSQ